jgi:hypothetical protein
MEIRDHDDVEEGEEEQRKRKREIRDHDDVEESEEEDAYATINNTIGYCC